MTGLDAAVALADRRVYAQDQEPADTRDGVIWVDTSVSPRRQYIYSDDSGEWESVLPTTTAQNATNLGYLTGPKDGTTLEWWDGDDATNLTLTLDGSTSETGQFGDPAKFGDSLYNGAYINLSGSDDVTWAIEAVDSDGDTVTVFPEQTADVTPTEVTFPEFQIDHWRITRSSSAGTNTSHYTRLYELQPHETAGGPHTHPL